jgi:hypothetical protein
MPIIAIASNTWIASIGSDDTASLSRTDSNILWKVKVAGGTGQLTCVDISPSGSYVACGSLDGCLYLPDSNGKAV